MGCFVMVCPFFGRAWDAWMEEEQVVERVTFCVELRTLGRSVRLRSCAQQIGVCLCLHE